MLTYLYGSLPAKLSNKEIDWDSDTIKVMLCTSSYTPNQDTHAYKSDVTNEVTGEGYVAGGATLTGKTVTYSSTPNTTKYDAEDVSWTSSTITARYAVLYDDTPATASAKPLIAYFDFEGDKAVVGGTISLVWDSNGIFSASV